MVCTFMYPLAVACQRCGPLVLHALQPWRKSFRKSFVMHLFERSTHVCWRMLTYADVCSRMLTYAHVCSRMLTYAHVCSRMQRRTRRRACACKTYAHVCSRMLTYAHVCYRMLTYAAANEAVRVRLQDVC
jgi:hypothetical protein